MGLCGILVVMKVERWPLIVEASFDDPPLPEDTGCIFQSALNLQSLP